jgi:hypothetical protein
MTRSNNRGPLSVPAPEYTTTRRAPSPRRRAPRRTVDILQADALGHEQVERQSPIGLQARNAREVDGRSGGAVARAADLLAFLHQPIHVDFGPLET